MKFTGTLNVILTLTFLWFLSPPLNSQTCYELVWSDEFSNEGLPDTANWSYEVGASGWGNNELQYYTRDRLENARVENGNLVIEARRESFLGADYTSARLITYPEKSFRYGKIEARIKLPYGQGIWPAFWMLGDGIFEGTPWPACGEIDIMEMVGGGEGKDDVVHGTVHWSDANGNPANYGGSTQLSEGIFADTFHVFSVEWNSTSIKWFLDGVQYHVVDITPSHMSEFHKDFFILLNIAVGGNWPGNPNPGTVFPQMMYVDYVRVYQSGTSPSIKGPEQVTPAESGVRFSSVESPDLAYAWTVPENAVITQGQGTHSILVDWLCDTGTVQCELTGICGQYNLDHKVNLKELAISGEDRIEAFMDNLDYAVPESREAEYLWTIPDGVTANSGLDSSSINLNWNDKDGSITLKVNNLCGSDSVGMMVATVLQQPYPDPETAAAIPGTVWPVNYDTGGEGISYHDTEAENLGPGSRQEEGVDTEINDNGETIGWLEPGEWTEYTIDVDGTDLYNVDIRVASTNSLGKFKLMFDGEDRTGDISVPNTGAWNSFTTVSLKNIQLNRSDGVMRVSIVNGLFNLGRMVFNKAATGLNDLVSGQSGIYLYPVPAMDRLFLHNLDAERGYRIFDMTGRVLVSGIISPGAHIPVGELRPGAYLLILEDSGAPVYSGKFFKSTR